MKLEVKKINEDDLDTFIELIKLFELVFEMKNFKMPEKSHLQNTLAKSNFIAMVAMDDNQVVGGLTTYLLDQYYATKPLAYIYDLAVSVERQRQGIGKKLIDEMTKHARDLGCEEVFVQADKIDQHAVDFYRATPVTAEEDVLHFYYSL